MGARSSVILKDGNHLSPVLCQHWGGESFHEDVKEWILEHYEKSKTNNDQKNITDRWEICRIFVRLVQKFGEDGYIEAERNWVDDSDYGCLEVDVKNEPKFRLLP